MTAPRYLLALTVNGRPFTRMSIADAAPNLTQRRGPRSRRCSPCGNRPSKRVRPRNEPTRASSHESPRAALNAYAVDATVFGICRVAVGGGAATTLVAAFTSARAGTKRSPAARSQPIA